ncbi:MAG: hypothetical protein ACK4S4_16090, partial [Pyrinomonadaceae bacterium]
MTTVTVRSRALLMLLAAIFALGFDAYGQRSRTAAVRDRTARRSTRPTPTRQPYSNAVLWENGDPRARDLFYGPGGREMVPDVSRVTFIKEE